MYNHIVSHAAIKHKSIQVIPIKVGADGKKSHKISKCKKYSLKLLYVDEKSYIKN